MIPVMRKVEDGWECCRCRFVCCGITDALTHAGREHGADPAWDPEGTVWDAREPSVLRAGGLI